MDQKELRRLESLCIQEYAPWCVAACPSHVDVRSINSALAGGDFDKALKIFRKSVLFPRIISHVCDHPCQKVCKLGELESTVSILELEKAVVRWATISENRQVIVPPRNKKIAVVGAGLSGLAASLDLLNKGYEVVLFEAGQRIGGSLWDFPETALPRDLIIKDFEILARPGLETHFDSAAGKNIGISDLEENFEAIYLGSGFESRPLIVDQLNLGDSVSVDPQTLQTIRSGVFAGGSLVRGIEGHSPIMSVSDGRRAAISIDRFCQNVSLSASRENEGPYQTKLYTSLSGVKPLPKVVARDQALGYSMEEAVMEAKRCLQCECMECVKVCTFLEKFKAYPKKYIRQIYNNLSIVMGQRHGNKFINSCSICGLCKEVCPEGLHMGKICKDARYVMVEQGKMPPSAHEFAVNDMLFSNSEKCHLSRRQPGTDSSAFVFFPGCQLSASSPQNVKKTYSYLMEKLEGGVGIMLGCCGAPADWAGRSDQFRSVISGFRSRLTELGNPTLIVACSSCLSVFKNCFDDVKTQSLWEALDSHGLPDSIDKESFTVAIHDACASRYENSVHQSVRNIIQDLGHTIHELPLNRNLTECCGYGGLMSFANRELAEEVIRRRISESEYNYVVYCAMCRDYFSSMEKPTWHLLDLIFGSANQETAGKKGPDYSQRRENRVKLRNQLLKEFWREDVDVDDEANAQKLRISSEVRNLMEQRMILVDDILEVINWAERTGSKFVGVQSGHFLAHYSPATVTYWVEYSASDDGYEIHNAYSHRMEIVEGSIP